jgi:phosphatidylglycerophosphate synthase
MARALPAWVQPDHLTLLAMIAALLVGLSYVLANLSPRWMCLSVLGLFLHWVGDSLDGTLARVRRVERERYGYYVDHIADAFSTVVVCVGFGLSPFIRLSVGLALAIGYLLLQIRSEIGAYAIGRFQLSFLRCGPTEVRILLAAVAAVLALCSPPTFTILGWSLTLVDVVCCGVAAVFFSVFVVFSIREARSLASETCS